MENLEMRNEKCKLNERKGKREGEISGILS